MSDMNFDQMVDSQEVATPAKRGLAIDLRKRPQVVVGGLPSVSLLPSEFHAAARDKTIRRALVGAVVVALVLAGGATAGAAALNSTAQSQLTAETARSQVLLHQLSGFSDVQQLQQSIAVGKAGATVGASTEIDWQAQIDAIEAIMPSGYTVDGIVSDSANAISPYQQGTTPLELPRAASLTLTVGTSSISQLPTWLRELRSIPAYADATTSVSSDDTAGYTIVLTIHLSPKALVNAKVTK